MLAKPWVESVAAIDDRTASLYQKRRPTADGDSWAVADTIVSKLCRLAEMAAVDRFPRLDHRPDRATDQAVRTVLDAKLAQTEPPASAVKSAADRVKRINDTVTVPLGGHPANWYVVFPWTSDQLSGLADDCGRLAGRCRAVGATTVAQTFSELADAMSALADLLAWLPTLSLWQSPPEELLDAEFREIESFAKRTLEATADT